MENKGSRAMAIAALIVGVVGLTIGFAAFTATLTINPTASVSTTETETTFQAAFGFAKGDGVTNEYDKNWAPSVVFSQDGSEITTAPVVEKEAVIKNDSAYAAYTSTTSVTLTGIKCTAGEGATDTLVQAACQEISGTVTLPGTVPANGTANATLSVTGPKTNVDGPFTVKFDEITINYTTAG